MQLQVSDRGNVASKAGHKLGPMVSNVGQQAAGGFIAGVAVLEYSQAQNKATPPPPAITNNKPKGK